MKLHYFGTAAAEGVPAIFCSCEVCRFAREHGGKEIRSRAQAMIDDKILLDFGPDTFFHGLRDGVDFTNLAYCLVTHAHEDHLLRDDLLCRRRGFAHLPENAPVLRLYGSDGVGAYLRADENGNITRDGTVVFKEVKPFEPFFLEDYKITPLPAWHGTEHPLIYAVEHEGKALLYGHDTDVFLDQVWQYLSDAHMRFDAVSLDCTEGVCSINYHGHMNFERNFEVRSRMLEAGLADEKTVFVANHFSHNGQATYETACREEISKGLVISYDQMDLVF